MRKTVLFFILIGTLGYSQEIDVFPGMQMGQTLDEVTDLLQPLAGTLTKKVVDTPVYPVSNKSEVHLICEDCMSSNGLIKEMAFTFSDDKLNLVHARGNAVEAILEKRKDTAYTFMDYVAYWDALIVADKKNDKVWLMSPESAHPNLFAWDNPYLPSEAGKMPEYNASAKVPDFLEMGASLEKLRPLLEKASKFTYTRELGPDDPNAQLQIDCFGIEYAGFPRKFEARFGDEKLNMVWILTGKGEEDRISQKLIEAYGPSIYTDEAWEAFNNWTVMLRKDKPEVLLLTSELADHYRVEYFKQ